MYNNAFDGKLVMHNVISNFIRSEEMFDFFESKTILIIWDCKRFQYRKSKI